jgi:hypothetical protein
VFENRVEIPADFVIAETNDSDAQAFESFGPSLVVAGQPRVPPAIALHRELGRVTIEIDDVAIERGLALELDVVEARTAQPRRGMSSTRVG